MTKHERREFLEWGVTGLAAATIFKNVKAELNELYQEPVEITIADLHLQRCARAKARTRPSCLLPFATQSRRLITPESTLVRVKEIA